MGQKSSPSPEELEFIYRAIARGLADGEVMDEMQDTELPLRNSIRFFRQRRLEFNAAKRVLGTRNAVQQDPIVIEKRGEHEERLVKALPALSRDPWEGMSSPYLWTDTGPEVVGMDYWHKRIGIPETLDVSCLIQHLDPEDEILATYRESGDVFKNGVDLSSQFSWHVIRQLREANLALRSDSTQTVPGIDDQFLYTVRDVASGLSTRLGTLPWVGEYKRPRPASPYDNLFKLLFDGLIIAVGSAEQVDAAEAIHRDIGYGLNHPELTDLARRYRDTRGCYMERAKDLNRMIEVRVLQRTFNKGPCEVCEAWGGL
jgi:hypothetical protein